MNTFDFTENVVLITLDSCRWDSFTQANAQHLKSRCKFRKAFSQGTYTYPAHMSIFSGILPNSDTIEPYYNRFCKNLFRMAGRRASSASLIEFPEGTENIIKGFERRGYKTIGFAAMEWFKHPNLNGPFQVFHLTGINFEKQIKYVKQELSASDFPFFLFINIGETHEPYEYGKDIKVSLVSRARMRAFENIGYQFEEHKKQILALEYVDGIMPKLFAHLNQNYRRSLVIVCGDHGDCFGEDGKYGHGFYHEKVMEVPLGIFVI